MRPMISIPAIPYMIQVKKFAQEKGYFFFTWRDMVIARRLYEEYSKSKN